MPLNITQTYAKIGIDTSPAKLELQTRNARLELKQNHAQMKMEIKRPKVLIDQYEAFASAGLKKPLDLTRSEVDKAKNKAMEYIGKVVADGNYLASIENGGNAIAEIAKRDFYTIHEFNMATMPKVGPEINVIEGDVNIELGKKADGSYDFVDTNYVPAELNTKYTPAQVRIFLSQYASINIDYVRENKIDTYI